MQKDLILIIDGIQKQYVGEFPGPYKERARSPAGKGDPKVRSRA
jgi:hypothetical protein